jgi:5-methylcytosine-specific restriction enzyme subunit McrC
VNRIELHEVGRAKTYDLDEASAAALAESKLVKLRRLHDGRWEVSANRKVGVARVAGVEVRINPKLKISRLFFMMGYYTKAIAWRDEDVVVTEAEDLVTAMAAVFERQASQALRQGALQGYELVEDTLAVIRGRLRLPEQVRRHYGLTMPLEVAYDEFTVDIPENQLLLTASVRLLQLRRIPALTERQLRRLIEQLGDVRLLKPNEPMPECPLTRLNGRYQKALHLAKMVVRASSAELGESNVPVSGFLLTMHRIFEDFVCVALTDELTKYRGYTDMQHDIYLDEGNEVTITPDLVWRSGPDRALAVVDAKYYLDMDNDHLKQMLTYCTVLNVKRGHLVYATKTGRETRHTVRGAGVEIVQHGLDLDDSRTGLLDQIHHISERIASDI